jgi:CRISPR type III-A-associated RAMP protein Csm5
MTKETGIIELETLVPLFIKDKDPEYGEGVYPLGDKIYLLDNDKLCEFLYDRTYDAEGNLREPGKDYVELYGNFLVRNELGNELDLYNAFAARFGLNRVTEKNRIPKEFKNRSVKFFLQKTRLVIPNQSTEEKVVRTMSKAVTKIGAGNGDKRFIVSGMGESYIPGSSIRGAFRNALLWTMLTIDPTLKNEVTDFVQTRLATAGAMPPSGKRKFAEKFCAPVTSGGESLNTLTASKNYPTCQGCADYGGDYVRDYNARWENASEMHCDLFRVLKISDAAFVGAVRTEAIPVRTYKLEAGNGGNVFNIKQNTEITLNGVNAAVKARFRITIDKGLAAEIFHGTIPNYLNSVPDLLKAVDGFYKTLADEERSFFFSAQPSQNFQTIRQWYQQLNNIPEGDAAESPLLFRVGWGGGMMSKTQFLHLSTADRKTIRNLTTDRGAAVAPKSRCLHVNGNNVMAPLGWCTLRYIGSNPGDYLNMQALSKVESRRIQSPPAGCVKAVILDAMSRPPRIKVEDGPHSGAETQMPGVTLQNLGLTNGSEVWVALVIVKTKLLKAEFRRAV